MSAEFVCTFKRNASNKIKCFNFVVHLYNYTISASKSWFCEVLSSSEIKNVIFLTACGCWQRWLHSWAHAGIKCRTWMWWIIRDRACTAQSCSHAGLSGVEDTHGAVACGVLCGVGSWGAGRVHGWKGGQRSLCGGPHSDVSWAKRREVNVKNNASYLSILGVVIIL